MTESEVFEAVTGSGSSDFATVVRILNEHSPWCLIGGLAVNCYVEPVFTVDVDIVVISAQLDRIREELISAGFQVSDFPHSLNALMPGSKLRIQLTLDPRYQDFLKDTKQMTVLGELVPVASLENVTRGKVWAWSDQKRRPTKRKKDELDLMRLLEAYPKLRRMMPDEIKRQIP
ncbi:MAG TPA: nucleotidyl transferase AbiEii/AbiGii toxin family protein [Pyrinomonadaceae bacterium]|nr:nucleotidyl transferase AbiEii/AbiGii toxin family protein [Pyrinomonadaceae bacterium]